MIAASRLSRSLAFAFAGLWLFVLPTAEAAEQYTLAPPAPQSAVQAVEIHFQVSGTAQMVIIN